MTGTGKVVCATAMFLISLPILAADAFTDGDRPIMQADTFKVTHRMIACEPALRATAGCHAEEQRRLLRRVRMKWIDAAVKIYGVALTPQEEADVTRQTAAAKAHIQTAGAHFAALAAAALRVRRGEERQRVLADVAKQGITPRDLDEELRLLPTLPDAERAASKDSEEDVRQSMYAFYAQHYIVEHLRELVRKRAEAGHLSFEVAEEQFWTDTVRRIHTQIVDPAFNLPDRKGILVSQ